MREDACPLVRGEPESPKVSWLVVPELRAARRRSGTSGSGDRAPSG